MTTRWFLFMALILLTACGKVAQDISDQSQKSIFKKSATTIHLTAFEPFGWSAIPSTKNATAMYAIAQGIKFNRGYQKIGWVHAHVKRQTVASKNTLVVTNYDQKKNTVVTSRYQQGFMALNEPTTGNIVVSTEFKKVRPKYDYYVTTHYSNKNTYIFNVQDTIPTASVTITPYRHLVSLLFINHLESESFDENSIRLRHFYDLIPTSSATPSANIMVPNNIKKFNVNTPLFSVNSDYFEAILNLINLSVHSEKIDADDYLDSLDETLFSDELKTDFQEKITQYFKTKQPVETSPTVVSPNAMVSTPNSATPSPNQP
jgi:hypothetical protein